MSRVPVSQRGGRPRDGRRPARALTALGVLPALAYVAFAAAPRPAGQPPAPRAAAPIKPQAAPPADAERPELDLQLGHSLNINTLAYSPDGKVLASGSGDGTIKLWDATTHDLIRTLSGHTAEVYSIAYAPDGKTLASGSKDGTIRIWDVATGRQVQGMHLGNQSVYSLVYSKDGRALASASGTGSFMKQVSAEILARRRTGRTLSADAFRALTMPDGRVDLWNPGNGQLIRSFTVRRQTPYSVALLPDSTAVAAGCGDGRVLIWNAATGVPLRGLQASLGKVATVAFSPDGRFLASAGADLTVLLWSTNAWTVAQRLSPPAGALGGGRTTVARTVSFSNNGHQLAMATAGSLDIWDIGQIPPQMAASVPTGKTNAAALSPDGVSLASAENKTINFRDTTTLRVVSSIEPRFRRVAAVAAPKGSTYLASASADDGAVSLWDGRTGSVRHVLPGQQGPVTALSTSPDGRILASSANGPNHEQFGQIALWDVGRGTLLRRLPGHAEELYDLCFSPDGRVLASASAKLGTDRVEREEIKLWDVNSGRLLRTLTGDPGEGRDVRFSNDGRLIAVAIMGQGSGAVHIWDWRRGTIVKRLSEPKGWVMSVAFSPDGRWLAGGSRESLVRIWDTRTWRLTRTLSGHGGMVKSVAFSPDGDLLASGSKDATIRLWNPITGQPVRVLRGHEFSVNSVAFTPDGHKLVSGSTDTTMRLWDVATGRQLAQLLTVPSQDPQAPGTLWVAVTPEGYYDCAEGADYVVKWRFQHQLVPFQRFEDTFRRPDLVRRALQGLRITERPLTLANLPPAAWIVRPTPEENVEGGAVPLWLVATDQNTLMDVQVYANGLLVPHSFAKSITADAKSITADAKAITADGKPVNFDFHQVPPDYRYFRVITLYVPLPPGAKEVVLRAVVKDDRSNQFDAAVTIHLSNPGEAPKPNLYLVSVGVSHYRNPNYDLKFAAADAEAVAQVMEPQQGSLYDKVVPVVLTDKAATAAGIRAALQKLQGDARPNDTVMVFLSGHGLQSGGKFYFAPWGTFIRKIDETCLPWQSMLKLLEGVYARKLLFSDACHSGTALGPYRATNEQLALQARKGHGLVVFSSSQGDEFSYEDASAGKGVFAEALVEALGGKGDVDGDGVITLPELALYVPKRVAELKPGLQNPQLVLVQDFNPLMPLARTATRVVSSQSSN